MHGVPCALCALNYEEENFYDGQKTLKSVGAFIGIYNDFSTVSIIAYADAEEPYVVSYGAPAVLMNEQTWVNLNDIYVEMKADGTNVSGAEIVWSASNQSGLVFDEFAKTIYAEKEGKYKLTATANGITKNVWVLVKTAEQEDFYLVKFDSFSADTFNADDWRMMKKKTTDIKELSGYEIKDGYFKTPHDNSVFYIGDEIFNDFADYTVTAYVSNTGAKTVGSSGAGTIGRMVYTEGATTYAGGIISFVRQNKSIGVANPASMGSSFPQVGPTGSAPWDGLNDYHTLKTIYDGEIVEFCFDDWSVLSNSDADYPCTDQTQVGHPGIMSYDSNTYVKNFSVKLNDNTLAPTFEKEYVGKLRTYYRITQLGRQKLDEGAHHLVLFSEAVNKVLNS